MRAESDRRRIARVILAASAGNALEFYDFTVFGYFATQIGATFFPSGHAARSLLLTFATFGVSFLARPLGAAILGGYADRRGRRNAMSLSILLMTLGTALMAFMPGYASIGAAAPAGILAARVIQGFSAGGEFGGATAFMIEHAPGRRGLFGSFQYLSQSVSAILGSGVAWAVSAAMGHQALQDWGFRIPFALGLLIGPVGFYVRRHVDETPEFAASVPDPHPIHSVIAAHSGRLALGACTIAAGTAGTYLVIYLPTYAQKTLHMSVQNSFAVTFAASCVPLLVTPLAAHLSDRIGRMPVMLGGAAVLLAISYPAFLAIVAWPTPTILALMLMAITFLRSTYTAPTAAMLAELFPVATRAVGMSLAYTMGVVTFGGFAGLILEWLISATGDPKVPAYYMIAATAITLAALLVIRRRVPMFA